MDAGWQTKPTKQKLTHEHTHEHTHTHTWTQKHVYDAWHPLIQTEGTPYTSHVKVEGAALLEPEEIVCDDFESTGTVLPCLELGFRDQGLGTRNKTSTQQQHRQPAH